VLNIGTGQETSVNQIYAATAKATGVPRPARYESARPGELQRSALDPARARLHLGWRPWTSLEDGVAATVASFAAARGER
jgi:UDP-glucose 4-epimerase